MSRQLLGRSVSVTLSLVLALLAAACDAAPPTSPEANESLRPVFADGNGGAVVSKGSFSFPFPTGAPPVSAACLGLEAPLRVIGTWHIDFHETVNPGGRVTYAEHLDYSDVELRSGDLVWRAAPGATETIVVLEDESGVRNITHVFHARYLSQNGLSDLQVAHSVHRIWGPDGESRRNFSVFFTANCIG